MRLTESTEEVLDLLVDSKYLEPSTSTVKAGEISRLYTYPMTCRKLLDRVASVCLIDALYLAHSNFNPLNRRIRFTKILDERPICWGTEIDWMWQE